MFKTKLLTTAIAFILSMGIQQNAAADLNDGLVAHWSFDDCKATDNSGNGHDGTLNGNPQCVDGVKGKAFSFDGSNDWLDGSINSDAFAGNWTISTWFYHTGYGTPWEAIFSNNTNSVTNAPVMTFRGADDNSVVIKNSNYLGINGVGSTPKGTFIDLDSHINQWIFAVITYENGVPTVYAYENGTLIKNSQTLPFALKQSNGFYIARHYSSLSTQLFKGSIDETRIYNRALTEAEVMELYEGKEKVASWIDLSLALTAPTSVKTAEKATYQLTATNNGNAPATGVKAHFVVPRKSIATVDIPKNCTLNGRIIECALSDLGANQSATQTFSMTALRKGALSVVGLVNSDKDDANYDDNKKSAVVSVK